ncbi:cytoplasmic protein [Xanthomonas oryzae pv. oryzae]|nr:cytoplasmic protein [Xanthomonas oryzae pv. oryzae]OLK44797.1 cytoplasmic protein [Xanthomonas oryzae pv. oryzae]UXW31402.1 DUF4276 family protein [Xanthomonas oryzae pv. oryzae]UZF12580.1 DUF4276 family protein [Xanthomonas oryzae pv. oryzae]
MHGCIIFLLEQPSMKVLLDGLLPRLFPGWQESRDFQCIAHDGKSDLERSVPRKLNAWRVPGDRFVVVRDNDSADCLSLKARLVQLSSQHGRPDALVRLVCQELESWYIADLNALALAFPECKIDTPALRKRFAQPDSWKKPSAELERLIPAFQKRSGARLMADRLREEDSRSPSFRAFVNGVRRLAHELGYQAPA